MINDLNDFPSVVSKYAIQKPLLVAIDPFLNVLPLDNYVQFSAFHPNPDIKDAETGLKWLKDNACDSLIAIGGGSAIDTAKAIKYLSGNQDLPLIAVPATAGTGSEATQIAVVYENGSKRSLDESYLLPDEVIFVPALLDTLPLYHKKACAMDALCQGIESFWARGANAKSRLFAQSAIVGMLDNLEPYLAGDSAYNKPMQIAAYDSGRAINLTRTTAAHAMSYKLTSLYGIAHGHAVLLAMPYLWERMPDAITMPLCPLLGLRRTYEGKPFFLQLINTLGLQAPSETPSEETLTELVRSVNVQRLQNHPIDLSENDILNIYKAVFNMA